MTTQPTPTPLTTFKVGLVHTQLARVMEELDAIPKDQRNSQQNFNFRGIDQIYNALNPLLKKHQLRLSAEVVKETRSTYTTSKGTVMQVSVLRLKIQAWATDGSCALLATATGEGSDAGDKATSKAWSIAMKYGLIAAFCIPTLDQEDGDATTPEPRGRPETEREEAQRTGKPRVNEPASSSPKSWRGEVGSRLVAIAGDNEKAQQWLTAILPGIKSFSQTVDDHEWRLKVAIGLAGKCANDINSAKKILKEQFGLDGFDKPTRADFEPVVEYLRSGKLPAGTIEPKADDIPF